VSVDSVWVRFAGEWFQALQVLIFDAESELIHAFLRAHQITNYEFTTLPRRDNSSFVLSEFYELAAVSMDFFDNIAGFVKLHGELNEAEA